MKKIDKIKNGSKVILLGYFSLLIRGLITLIKSMQIFIIEMKVSFLRLLSESHVSCILLLLIL